MNCQACRVAIEETSAALGDLSTKARLHVKACSACQSFFDEQVRLQHLIGDLERISAPADFDFRLRARLATVKRSQLRWAPRSFGFIPGSLSVALAVCFVAAVASALFLKQHQMTTALTAQSADSGSSSAIDQLALNGNDAVRSINDAANNGAVTAAVSANGINAIDDFRRRRQARYTGSRLHNQPSSYRHPTALRPAAIPTEIVASLPVKPDVELAPDASRIASYTFNVSGATVSTAVSGTEVSGSRVSGAALLPDAATKVNDFVFVSVQGPPAQPAQVLLQDGRGAQRIIALEPVTFGAHQLIEPLPAAETASQGVW